MKRTTLVIAMALATTACATKQYGRVQQLSLAEKEVYECREIKIEYAKLIEFEKQIDQTGSFNSRTVFGFLGDFGIGNGLAKSDARKSARQRRADLDSLSAERNCNFTDAETGKKTTSTKTAATQTTD